MSSKEDLNKAISIGINAERLLGDELLSSVFFSIKNSSCESFMRTNIADDKKRKELWQDVQGVIRIEQELQQLVETGRMAQDQLNLLASQDQLIDSPHSPFTEGNA